MARRRHRQKPADTPAIRARRAIRPHRDAVSMLLRNAYPQMSEDTRICVRDCHDHTVQIMELVETYREKCADVRDNYLSFVSNRMNETMKVLTIIATNSYTAGFYRRHLWHEFQS